MAKPRRVLVVDDSDTTRAMLAAVIEDHPGLIVVAQARNGREAVAAVERDRPDIITMDVRMPGMDGIEATKQIMCEHPTPIVIVAGGARDAEVRASLEAMQLGALAVLPKPRGPLAPEFAADCTALQRSLVALADVSVVTRRGGAARQRSLVDHPRARGQRVRAVALAASTGGPCVLRRILAALPEAFDLPVLIVQHIAPGFVTGLATWLQEATPLRVGLAQAGAELQAGHVYLAPDDRHLGVEGHRIVLDASPPIGHFRPSADFLFTSVARAFGRSLLAVILTGMGRDGVTGLRAVDAASGQILAQDEASCVVYGMPGEAVAAGLVGASFDPDGLAAAIRRAAGLRA